ncbi:ATP-binding protein [Streptodolium elevatio]
MAVSETPRVKRPDGVGSSDLIHGVFWALIPEPEQVKVARDGVREQLTAWGVDATDVVQTLVLGASELVTNSVIHTGDCSSRIDVSLELRRNGLRLAVGDRHGLMPRPVDADETAENGRGLQLVRALVDECHGVTEIAWRNAGGKVVSMLLPWPTQDCTSPSGS